MNNNNKIQTTNTFTAIDFETAQGYRHTICQVGLVRVENGIITQEIDFLVQPPDNYYWEKLVFDFQYQRKFDLLNRSKIHEDAHTEQGIYLSNSTLLEVKQVRGKRLAKTTANKLIENTLFPIYTIAFENEISNTNTSKKLRVMQEEKGLLAKYAFSLDQFEWEKLCFVISQQQKSMYLSAIKIGEEKLVPKTIDTLVTGNNVWVL